MEPNRHGWTLVCCGLLLVGVIALVLPPFPPRTARWMAEARDYITVVLIIGGSAGALLSLSPLRNVRVPLPRSRITDDLLDARTLGSQRAPNPEDERADSAP
jgi:acyl-CoA synthetase (AMP-forming)/AMP-acid ligase II